MSLPTDEDIVNASTGRVIWWPKYVRLADDAAIVSLAIHANRRFVYHDPVEEIRGGFLTIYLQMFKDQQNMSNNQTTV
jgi:hypothetical protein